MRESTIQRAQGRWAPILKQIGVPEQCLQNKHTQCPLCEGHKKFRFDDKDGSGSFICNNCGGGYGMHLAMQWTGLSMPEMSRKIDEYLGLNDVPVAAAEPKRDPRPALRKVARLCVPAYGSINPVTLYLRRRELAASSTTQLVASQPYWESGQKLGEFPAMVHLVVNPEGDASTYHVTYLTPKGDKAPVDCPRKMMTPVIPFTGGAIRLFEAKPVMGIAEGVETALAAHQKYRMPVWAAVNAGNLEQFVPPPGTEVVHIFADNDASYTGQASAYALARRLVVKHKIGAVVHVPKETGTDFADELRERKLCNA